MIAKELKEIVWSPRIHIPELDGLRGCAILLVTFYRFGRDIQFDDSVARFFSSILKMGDRGVDLFFVLSGFLITGILIESKASPNYFSSFYLRRTLRIFPLYYVSLLLFLIVIPRMFTHQSFELAVDQQAYLWTYLTNARMAWTDTWCFGSLDHFWSLAVEEHFYLVWPFVIYALTTRKALLLCLLLAASSVVARAACVVVFDWRVAADVLTIFRLDGLCLGSALAIWFKMPSEWRLPRSVVLMFVGIIATISVGLAFSERSLMGIGHTAWSLTWAGFLMLVLTAPKQGVLSRIFSLRPLRHFGKYSYAMYVFQSPLIPIMSGIVSIEILSAWTGENLVSGALYVVLMLTVTWLAAQLSWWILERHFIRLKDRFQAKRTPLKTTSAQGTAYSRDFFDTAVEKGAI